MKKLTAEDAEIRRGSQRRAGKTYLIVQSVYHSHETVAHANSVEIQQVSKPEVSEFQVCQELSPVQIIEFVHRLDFNDNLFIQ